MIEKDKKGYIKHLLKAGLFSILCGAITGLLIFIFKFLQNLKGLRFSEAPLS